MKHILATIACLLSFSAAAASDDYPTKVITIVSPFGPGTASDTVIRALAQRLAPVLKVPVIVDNRPGANGMIATARAAKAAPDGYSLILTTGTTVSQNPWLFKDIQYDPLRDFAGIAVLGGFPLSVIVAANSPYQTIEELLKAIKSSDSGITYATAYGMQTVCGEMLGKQANGKVLAIPHKSTPLAVLDVLAGRIAFACGETATTLSLIQNRTLHALAVLDPAGSRYLPAVPTIQKTNPDFPKMQSWIGLAGPAGLPKDKIQLLSDAIYKIAADPSFTDSLSVIGYEPTPMNAAQTTQFMKDDNLRWKGLIQQVRIQPQ